MFSTDDAAAVRTAHLVWGGRPEGVEPADWLYSAWWAPTPGPDPTATPPGLPPLGGRLRVAHGGSLRWLTGCRVTATGEAGSVVVAAPGGFDRALSQGDHWNPARPGLPARVGDEVTAVDRSGGYESEGWWRTWGGGWDLTRPAPDVSRCYLAVAAQHLTRLVAVLPAALDRETIGWTLKIGAADGMLARPDAVVLYVHDTDRDTALGIVSELLRPWLRPDRALPFTRRAAAGVCWAEDPGGDESFGQVRCRLLATGFMAGGDPVVAAAHAFETAAIDPAQPHLRSRP